MKLLITLDFPPELGGIQRYLHDIVINTFSNEDIVLVGGTSCSSTRNDAVYPCRIIRRSLPLNGLDKKTSLVLLIPHLLLILIKRKQMTVFAGNIYAAFAPWILSFVFPLNYHIYCYGTELFPMKRRHTFKSRLWKSILKRSQKIYYLTNTTLDILREHFGSGPYQQNVPKINLAQTTFSIEKHDQKFVSILSVGRLVPHKGHANLLKAVAAIPVSLSWHLTIIGNGPERSNLQKTVLRCSLEEKVTVETDVSDSLLSDYYKKAHIFVLPSIETSDAVEGFGIVLLEAMAFGVAVVASRSGGIGEVFQHNTRFAEIVEPGNPDALRDSICKLYNDRNMRKKMAQNAHQLVKKYYVW